MNRVIWIATMVLAGGFALTVSAHPPNHRPPNHRHADKTTSTQEVEKANPKTSKKGVGHQARTKRTLRPPQHRIGGR